MTKFKITTWLYGGGRSCASHFIDSPQFHFNYDQYNQTIYCLGTHSCISDMIRTTFNHDHDPHSNIVKFENIENIYCAAADTCLGIQIVNPHNVYFMSNRFNSINHTSKIDNTHQSVIKVTNTSIHDRRLTSIFFQTHGAGAHVKIICDRGTKCNIYCESLLSCSKLITILQCDGNCTVNCHIWDTTPVDDYYYYCPAFVVNNSHVNRSDNIIIYPIAIEMNDVLPKPDGYLEHITISTVDIDLDVVNKTHNDDYNGECQHISDFVRYCALFIVIISSLITIARLVENHTIIL